MDLKDDKTLCKVFIYRGRFQIIYYLILLSEYQNKFV